MGRWSRIAPALASVLALAPVAQAGTGAPGDPTEAPSTEISARAGVLPIVVDGELNDADQQALAAKLVEGLERGSFGIIAPGQVAAAAPEAASCASKDCYASIASKAGATHLVRATVTVQDRDYQILVELIDGATGDVLARSDDGCEICGVADVGGLLSAAAATLRTKLDALASGPATLILNSDPPDADVFIDGELAGTTPLDRPVIPGKHILRVQKDGFITLEREVTFVEGVREEMEMSLDKVPSRLPGRAWGWASLGVGVAALGGGVALTYLHDLDHDPTCAGNNVDAFGNCKFLWDTKWAGVGTAIGGAALTTLGVAILLNTRKVKAKRVDPDKAEAKVGVGFGSVTVRGRF